MGTEDGEKLEAAQDHHDHRHPEADTAKMTDDYHKHEGGGDNSGKGYARSAGGYYKDPWRAFCAFLVIFLVLAGVTALILWLVYRPHKPKFAVVSAAVYELNLTAPPFMYATMQFTVVTRNSNRRVSFSYDHLSAVVSYKNQAITPPVMLPPLYHETKSTLAMSTMLGGGPVPVSADVANGLLMDEAYGVVALRLVLLGKLRYKAGAFKTGRYGLYVRCDVLIALKRGFAGQVPLLGSSRQCHADV